MLRHALTPIAVAAHMPLPPLDGGLQEADAGQLDNPEDKDFTVTREDEQAAEAARNEPLAEGGARAPTRA